MRAAMMPNRGRPRARWLLLLLIAAIALPLASCGKRGQPGPPPGEKSVYPKTYPNPDIEPNE
jgi:predicted small lipoprotein YifL